MVCYSKWKKDNLIRLLENNACKADVFVICITSLMWALSYYFINVTNIEKKRTFPLLFFSFSCIRIQILAWKPVRPIYRTIHVNFQLNRELFFASDPEQSVLVALKQRDTWNVLSCVLFSVPWSNRPLLIGHNRKIMHKIFRFFSIAYTSNEMICLYFCVHMKWKQTSNVTDRSMKKRKTNEKKSMVEKTF